mmetsp:Transcript_2895/g.4519  ORF Transcript_2895/g.4519 Transcript_2895/m.4519 type:complete len:189 (+) Transcript_2895:2026-2592(+)
MHYVICCPPIIPHLAQNLSQAGITSQSNTAFLYAGAEMTQIEKVEYVDDNFPVNAHERCCYTTLDAPSHFVYQFIYGGESSSIWRRYQTLKFSLFQLSTLERRTQWDKTFPSTCCRICTNPDLPRGALAYHENLRHLLLDCLCPKIVDARKHFVADIFTLAQKHDFDDDTSFSSFVQSAKSHSLHFTA